MGCNAIAYIVSFLVMKIINETGIVVDDDIYNWLVAKPYRIGSIKPYLDGISEQAIARQFGVSRNCIRTAIERCGITPRSRKEANSLRMSKLTKEEKKKLTKNANEKVRNGGFNRQTHLKGAITKQSTGSKIGVYESCFAQWVRELNPVQQLAINVYNIDIAVGNLAVEIDSQTAIPHHCSSTAKRIKHLLSSSFSTLYIRTNCGPVTKRSADYAISMIEEMRRDPSSFPQHRVIDGSGNLLSAHSLNGDELTCIYASRDVFR
jgi:transposase